jgi:hypothetical protein
MFKNVGFRVVFPLNRTKLEFAQTCSERESNNRISADFAQVFSFGPDAFVAAPQAVETRALQPLGCHGEVMVGGIGMNSGNPKNVYKLSGFRSLWNSTESFMALNGLIWTCMYVHGHVPFFCMV